MTALVNAAARLFTRVAAIFLLAMVGVNVLDVGLRSTLNAPIYGTYELVELFLGAVAFLAIPETFLRGQHITVELIDQVVPSRAIEVLKALGMLAAFVFLALLTYHMVQPAVDFVTFNEVTMDLALPKIWQASLIMAGVALAVIATFVVFVREVRAAFGRGPRP